MPLFGIPEMLSCAEMIEVFLLLCFNINMTMRILVDTNIIIALEDNNIIEARLSEFFRYATSNQCSLYYHPGCLKDLSKDKDLKRREIILSNS